MGIGKGGGGGGAARIFVEAKIKIFRYAVGLVFFTDHVLTALFQTKTIRYTISYPR